MEKKKREERESPFFAFVLQYRENRAANNIPPAYLRTWESFQTTSQLQVGKQLWLLAYRIHTGDGNCKFVAFIDHKNTGQT